MDKNNFAKRLRRFAKSQWPSLRAFADDLEIAEQSLHSSYLNGRSLPGSEFIYKLILFGCDANWLLSGEGRAPEQMEKNERQKWIETCESQAQIHRKQLELDVLVKEELKRNRDRWKAEHPEYEDGEETPKHQVSETQKKRKLNAKEGVAVPVKNTAVPEKHKPQTQRGKK